MVTVQKEGIILEKTNREFESHGVMNPATIQQGEDIHLYYRAVGKDHQSTIGYCRLIGPKMVADRWQRPMMVPESGFEKNGLEDPRIVKIENQYYLTYTGFDGINARAALAISENLFHFTKIGIIAPPFTQNEFIAGAALLDLNDPCKVIARLPYTLFKPEFEWEKRGEANNVVFPTGTAQFGDTLYIYYGAANERIAVASVNLPDLVDELLSRW